MNAKYYKTVISVLLFCFAVSMPVSAQIKLALNLEKGKKYEYRTDATQTVNMAIGGQKIPMENKVLTVYQMDIIDKTDKGWKVKYTFQQIGLSVSSMMMKMSYDSRQTAEPTTDAERMLAATLKPLIDHSFTATILSDGKVTSVEGMDAMLKKIDDSMSGNPMTAQMITPLKQQFSDDALKQMIGQSYVGYPDKAIKKGESWNSKISTDLSGMKTLIDTKYTLAKTGDGIADIDIASDLDIEMSQIGSGKITGTQTGTMKIDTKTGVPVASDLVQKAKGTISANNMTIEMELESHIVGSTKEK